MPVLEAITEEHIAAPAVSVSPAQSNDPARAAATRHENSDTPSRKNLEPPRAPAARESGIVEIVSSDARTSETTPPPLTRPAPTTTPARPLPAVVAIDDLRSDVFMSARAASPSAPAGVTLPTPPAPTAPVTNAELIQHVFRWVGQNPGNIIPPALGDRPALGGPAPILAPTGKQPEPAVSVPLAPAVRATPPSPSPPASVPPPAHSAPARAPAPAAAPGSQESTVEISIGTLQIHVDSPPAPKPVRRPTAPRPPARGQPAAARPAIDLNRLRRGFYL